MSIIYSMAKLTEQVVFKAPVEWVDELKAEAARDRRTASAVLRAIFERGYLAYKRDGNVFEPTHLDPKDLPGAEPGKRGVKVANIN